MLSGCSTKSLYKRNMKIFVPNFCAQCNDEAIKLGKEYIPNESEIGLAELNELGIYHYLCTNGHKQTMILKQQLFQILFDLGALALSDSYTREAVSSFTSSLERFFEFITKLIVFSDDMNEKILDDFWKNISNYSERQLGAYLSLYTYKFKKNPNIPNDKWREFRNDVVHKGKIPNSEKTLEYGQLVADIILNTLSDVMEFLKDDFKKCLAKLESFNIKKIEKDYPNIKNVSLDFMKTLIDFNVGGPLNMKKFNLNVVIDDLRKSKKIIPYIK